MEENLENLKKKDVKQSELEKGGWRFKKDSSLDWKAMEKEQRKKEREQKIAEREKRLVKLQEKRQRQIEEKTQRMKLKQLKYETSLTGRLKQQLKEKQKSIKSRQKTSIPKKQTSTPKTTIPKKVDSGSDYVVIGNNVYQKKGTVTVTKKEKKKDEESGKWIP